jgi:hypothetical protein
VAPVVRCGPRIVVDEVFARSVVFVGLPLSPVPIGVGGVLGGEGGTEYVLRMTM